MSCPGAFRIRVYKSPVTRSIKQMPTFRWEDIDHSLVGLRLTELAIDMHARIRADEARIQFENRGNLNSSAVPSLVLEMKQESADEWARRVYEIYCDVWQKQGNNKCAAFVRAVSVRAVLPTFRARTGAITGEFSLFATRTSFPSSIRDATLKGLQLNMLRLEDRCRRRLEIEAKECEHAEQRAMLAQDTAQRRDKTTEHTPIRKLSGSNLQPPAREGDNAKASDRSILEADPRLERKKPGRNPRLCQPFVIYAGTLWQKALENHSKISLDQLCQIASALDAAHHRPPSAYLEGKYAEELKSFNSRNSNSKIGPINSWSDLVSRGDKDLLRGMRRLLSRCAEKVDDGHPPSGN
jgi:hypothetical protein